MVIFIARGGINDATLIFDINAGIDTSFERMSFTVTAAYVHLRYTTMT